MLDEVSIGLPISCRLIHQVRLVSRLLANWQVVEKPINKWSRIQCDKKSRIQLTHFRANCVVELLCCCLQTLKAVENNCVLYSRPMDKDAKDSACALLKRARITLTEHVLLDEQVLSTQSGSYCEGVQQTNEFVATHSLADEANDEAFTIRDLNCSVWKYADQIAKGGKLSLQ